MEFVDRKSAYPNRYTMTDEAGNVSTVYLERADDPVVEGTPLNAKTFNSLLLASESEKYPGCYYITTDGDTEWINPPMIPNATHKTCKRFNGYPVYVVVVVFDALPASGDFVSIKLTGATIAKVVSFKTTYYPKDNDLILPIKNDPFVDLSGLCASADVRVNELEQEVMIMSHSNNMTYYSAVCIIEFTKAEEAL